MDLVFKKPLGRGQFGRVWLAQNVDLRKLIAIKFVDDDEEGKDIVLRHARALAKVDHHDNLVKVYSLEKVKDPESGRVRDAILMEYVEGKTLAEILRSSQIMGAEDAFRIISALISGVRHLHQNETVHGDLHEQNILINDKQVKIIDLFYLDLPSIRRRSQVDMVYRRLVDITFLRQLAFLIIDRSELSERLTADISTELRSAEKLEGIEALIEKLKRQVVRQELSTLHFCQRKLEELMLKNSEAEVVRIRHLGLDMSQAGDRLATMIKKGVTARATEIELLMMGPPESFPKNTPDTVLGWAAYSCAALEAIRKSVLASDARLRADGKTLRILVRRYCQIPRFHGFSVTFPADFTCISVCYWSKGEYLWGEDKYLVIDGSKSMLYLLFKDVFDGEFEFLWDSNVNEVVLEAGFQE